MAGKKNTANHKSKERNEKKSTFSGKNFSAWLIGITLVLTFISYLPALQADFVNWDDPDYVLNNSAIRSFANIHELLTNPLMGNYHPLTMLSLALNYALSGKMPGSYHLLNLLLHLLNTFLVFKLASRLSNKNNLIAFTTALLFGIHPMHVESVAWVSERKDVLYAFFFLLGLISYLKYVDNKERKAYYFCLGWFILSLASKPAAIVFPLALFTVDFFRGRKYSLRLFIEKIPFLLFACVFAYFTMQAQKNVGATEGIEHFAISTRILFASYGYLMYFIKLILPVELGAFHPLPLVDETLPSIYFLSPLFFLGIIILCWRTYKKYPVITFGFAFYLVNLLLVLQFIVIGSAIISERYTYIPYIGLFFIFGWLLDQKFRRKPSNAYSIMIVIGIVFTIASNVQARVWKNNLSLWQRVLKYNQTSSKPYENLALYYRDDLKDNNKALENFMEAVKYHRNKALIYNSIGKIYFDFSKGYANGKEKEQFNILAVENFKKAIQQDSLRNHPDHKLSGEIFINYGSALAFAGLLEDALGNFNLGLKWDPSNKNGYLCRSLYYITKGNFEKAIEEDSVYLTLNPNDADIYCERGVSLFNVKRFQEAIDDLNKAILLKNTEPNFFLERARIHHAMGNRSAANQDAEVAQRRGMKVEPELLQ